MPKKLIHGLIRRLPLAFGVCTAVACQSAGIDAVYLTGIDTLLPPDNLVLSQPTAIVALQSGELLVVDRDPTRFIILSPNGDLIRRIGSHGSGPGQFISPRSVQVVNDTIRLVDGGNGRIQLLDITGDYLSTAPLPPGGVSGDIHFSLRGDMLVALNGTGSALVDRL